MTVCQTGKKANVVFLFFHVTIYTRAIVRVGILYFDRVLFSVYPCVSKWHTLKVVKTNYDRISHLEFSVKSIYINIVLVLMEVTMF